VHRKPIAMISPRKAAAAVASPRPERDSTGDPPSTERQSQQTPADRRFRDWMTAYAADLNRGRR